MERRINLLKNLFVFEDDDCEIEKPCFVRNPSSGPDGRCNKFSTVAEALEFAGKEADRTGFMHEICREGGVGLTPLSACAEVYPADGLAWEYYPTPRVKEMLHWLAAENLLNVYKIRKNGEAPTFTVNGSLGDGNVFSCENITCEQANLILEKKYAEWVLAAEIPFALQSYANDLVEAKKITGGYWRENMLVLVEAMEICLNRIKNEN